MEFSTIIIVLIVVVFVGVVIANIVTRGKYASRHKSVSPDKIGSDPTG